MAKSKKVSRFFTNPGSPIHTIYAPKVDADGRMTLVPSGTENTDDYIQSFKESTDMAVILARVAQGETELLHARTGSFGDFTQVPKTYAETLQLQIDAKRLYDGLPAAIKSKFNNDSSQFFASAGTQEWYDKISPAVPREVSDVVKPTPVPTPTVIKEGDVSK